MNKALKFFIGSLLAATIGITTVVCCCVGPSVMAHLRKTAMCSHCPTQSSSHSQSGSPTDGCMYRLSNAEASHGQIVAVSASIVQTSPTFFDHPVTPSFLAHFISAYPRGSPPLTASLIPPYLRTFNLRI